MQNLKVFRAAGWVFGAYVLGFAVHARADLPKRFEIELQRVNPQTARLHAEDVEALNRFQFVLVDGMLGDFVEDLYGQTAPQLRTECGVRAVRVLRPSSFDSLIRNADQLAYEFSRAKVPLIVIAHSRGAAETALALIRHPELITGGTIARAILVQGAYGGSPLAEFVRNRFAELCPNGRKSMLSDLCDLTEFFRDSVHSLVPLQTRAIFRDARATLTESDREAFRRAIRFVGAKSEWSEVRFPLMSGAAYLGIYFGEQGPNDGVLLTEQMWLPGLGRHWGILNSDHFGLLGGTDAPHSKPFLRALIRELISDLESSDHLIHAPGEAQIH